MAQICCQFITVCLLLIHQALNLHSQGTPVDDGGEVLHFTVTEQSPAFTFIGNLVTAAKLQESFSDEVLSSMEFSFLPQPHQDDSYFTMDHSTGIIRTSQVTLDREEVCGGIEKCTVEVDVGIVKPIEHSRFYTASIAVNDINDNAPTFPQSSIKVKFSESAPVNSTVNLPIALDPDSARFGVKRYDISTSSGLDKFEILSPSVNELKLRLKGSVDREQVAGYQVEVTAYDGGNPALVGTLQVEVVIEDANDHQPRFSSARYVVNISESFPTEVPLFTAQAQDADSGTFGEIRYRFSPVTESIHGTIFTIGELSGEVDLKEDLDYERTKVYSLDVIAEDGGVDSQAAQTTLVVNVEDINDNPPQITFNILAGSNEAVVIENADVDKFVAYVSIYDADTGENGRTTCTLNSEAFKFQPQSKNRFKLVTAQLLDREVQDRYQLVIECSDNGSPSLSSEKELLVIVEDENDHVPLFSKSEYVARIVENNHVGDFILKVNATDRDIGDNGKINFAISSGALTKFITINPNSGVITAASRLNFEEVKEINFEVTATDSGGGTQQPKSATSMVTITVLDQNDLAPQFTQPRYSFEVLEKQTSGLTVGTVTAVDHDSDLYNAFTYVFQSSQDAMMFDLNPVTGSIKTTDQLDRETQGSYHLTVRAIDENDDQLVGMTFVDIMVGDINDNYPQIHYPTSENDTVYISSHVPVGYTILKVQATDDDLGQNANLSYMLMKNDDKAFHIDPIVGILETNQLFTDVDIEEHSVTVLVKDHGNPPKAATSTVRIIVDSSIAYSSHDSTGIVRQNNLTIIIAVATVSGLIMVVLLIAIVMLKTVDRRRGRFVKHTCTNNVMERDREQQKVETEYTNGANSKKEVSFVLEPEDMDKQLVPMQYEGVQPASGHMPYPADSFDAAPPKHPNSQLEAHLISMKHQNQQPHHHHHHHHHSSSKHPHPSASPEPDNASSSSGEISNADSGRGPSEEGERDTSMSRGGAAPVIPPRGIPARAGNGSGGGGNRGNPQVNSVDNGQQRVAAAGLVAAPPSYNTFLRNKDGGSGRRSNGPNNRRTNSAKLPCKKHGQPVSESPNPYKQVRNAMSAVNFGDRPRNSYYGNRSHDSSGFMDSLPEGMDRNEAPRERQGEDDVFYPKGVIV